MGERHVTHAQITEHTQHTHVVSDHVTAFDADQSGDLPLRVCVPDFFRRAAKGEVLRILNYVLVHRIYLVQRLLYRWRAHDSAVNPDGKENRVHPTFPHARYVDMPVGIALADVEVLR